MEPQTMSLQCFKYSPPKTFPLAAAVKIACAIFPLCITLRSLGRPLLGNPVSTAGLLADPLHIALDVLSSTLHEHLANRVNRQQVGVQSLTASVNRVLADSLWLSDDYHFSQLYHTT